MSYMRWFWARLLTLGLILVTFNHQQQLMMAAASITTPVQHRSRWKKHQWSQLLLGNPNNGDGYYYNLWLKARSDNPIVSRLDMPQYRLASYIRSNHHRIPYTSLAAESIKRNSAWNIISSGLEFDSRKTRTRQMSRQQYYGDYHQQSCCGGSHNGSSDILKPVLFSFLLPLAIGLSLALLWLLLQSVRVGTIAFLQQQQQGQQQQGQQSSNNNLNVNNNNHDTISISITNTATG